MKSGVVASLLLIFSLSAFAAKLPKLSPEEIEDRSVAAMTGTYPPGEKAPQSIVIRSHMVDKQGRTWWIAVWQWKSPDRWYRQIKWLDRKITAESGFDGQVAWWRTEGEHPHVFDEKDLIASREVGALDRRRHWRAYLKKVENDGTDRLGNADVYRVRETHLDGRESTVYFDATTFFRLREDWIGFGGAGTIYFTDYYLDYRRGHGLTFAFHVHRISHEGSPLSSNQREQDLLVDDIQLNTDIPDAQFAMPGSPLPVSTDTKPIQPD